jgi:hypothetical protein
VLGSMTGVPLTPISGVMSPVPDHCGRYRDLATNFCESQGEEQTGRTAFLMPEHRAVDDPWRFLTLSSLRQAFYNFFEVALAALPPSGDWEKKSSFCRGRIARQKPRSGPLSIGCTQFFVVPGLDSALQRTPIPRSAFCKCLKRMAPQVGLKSTIKRSFNGMQSSG